MDQDQKERMRVTIDLTVYNEDGSVFYKAPQEWQGVDRGALHAIQRAQLEAARSLLDTAEKVRSGEIPKS